MSFSKNKFFTYNQVQGKSFDEFINSLQKLSVGCEFGELVA